MAGKGKLVVSAVRLGVKYGPQLWVASKALREPAKEAGHKLVASDRARKAAFEHAQRLSDGTVLKVPRTGETVWVVFSGDTAVSVYPTVDVPLSALVDRADLTRRVRPGQQGSVRERAKDAADAALRRGDRPGGTPLQGETTDPRGH
ncbi:hypothetical protein [Terracoccus luteus]|uniref:Uncharacterized protein n=1 Tax=Terracoccus luteus TaxID=53356 RepID=A0A839PP43_9MICO|nr:hypothetical protein [Terracoccus luteus]MBB2986058.1 hypothetical protein [Terracoccus luteus]MCP2171710.1 hypothetical protein [Terracoccus luteus]